MKVRLQFFGGRGASSGGGGTSVTSVMTQSGIDADLTGNPLVYSDSGSTMTADQRKTIEAQEAKRANAKIEFASIVDENGNIVGKENKGGPHSVQTPWIDMNQPGVAMTHNHPRNPNEPGERGVLGGTFSNTDINTFSNNSVKNYRASGAEGTYSITKGPNFDAKGLKDYYKQAHTASRNKYDTKFNDLKQQYNSHKIDYNTLISENAKAFNSMLVENHNTLLAGQKKYGYSYGLEARP